MCYKPDNSKSYRQEPGRWDDHVSVYETVFEPFTMQWAGAAIAVLGVAPGQRVLDVAAGSGGAALEMAARGADETAIDVLPKMVERMLARAASRATPPLSMLWMGRLAHSPTRASMPDYRCSASFSFPMPHGGSPSCGAWFAPTAQFPSLRGPSPINTSWPPCFARRSGRSCRPRLCYREEADFRALFTAGGLAKPRIENAELEAAATRWLAERLAFAPGMAVMIAGLGSRRAAVAQRFAEMLKSRHRLDPIRLKGLAFVGTERVSAGV
jgi:SAM-dependent methyltransferase